MRNLKKKNIKIIMAYKKNNKYYFLKLIIYIDGWGGRIRTYGTRDQNPMPYHLATPQLFYWKYIIYNLFSSTLETVTLLKL